MLQPGIFGQNCLWGENNKKTESRVISQMAYESRQWISWTSRWCCSLTSTQAMKKMGRGANKGSLPSIYWHFPVCQDVPYSHKPVYIILGSYMHSITLFTPGILIVFLNKCGMYAPLVWKRE